MPGMLGGNRNFSSANRSTSISQRKAREETQNSNAVATETIVKGKIPIIGGGDAAADINFPIWFTEAPHMTFGGEVAGSVDQTLGSFPILSVLVGKWQVQTLDATETRLQGRQFYTGAQLLMAISGTGEIIVHYQFSGMAITNPTGVLTSMTSSSFI